ncbi:MAG: Zn-dependent protease with chaperone function [Frankiales bacterium]|nr:Zn-dependent protease with chaperone function [Frankiales bacterium]
MRRAAPALAAAVLLGATVVLALLLLPWHPLPGARSGVDVLRDFTPAQLAREEAFHRALRPWSYASLAVGLVVAGLLGLTRAGARLVAAVARPLGGGWVWQVLLGTVAVAVVGRLATLPLDLRSESVLRRYGLSSQTWGTWAADAVKGTLVGAVLTALALVVVVGLARRLPRTWWAWAAGGVFALVVAGSFAYPVVVEPLFNDFTPLPQGQLRTDLLALADRDGVPVEDVLVADASRRTTALNAYVSGFGPSRRIVLYDTLVKTSTPREVELVVAHELGHAKADDVGRGTLLGALGAAGGVCLLGLLLSSPWLRRRAGVDGPGDARGVALLSFLVAAASFVTLPAVNLATRHVEARADVHALDLTQDPETFARSEVRLSTVNLSDLDPPALVYGLFSTHPTGPQRLQLAREWARLHAAGRR